MATGWAMVAAETVKVVGKEGEVIREVSRVAPLEEVVVMVEAGLAVVRGMPLRGQA